MTAPPLPFAPEDLANAFMAWLESDEDHPRGLLRRLRLPGTRRAVLRSLRDVQLIAACVHIVPRAKTEYARAVALREACVAFAAHQWPAWQKLRHAPDHATPTAQLLHHAFRFNELAEATRDGRPRTPADWSISQFRQVVAGMQ